MDICKKKHFRRVSVWVLIFSLLITACCASLTLSAHAKNFLDEGANDVKDAARNAASDVGSAVSDMGDNASDGAVNDHDGVIGNEGTEAAPEDNGASAGWLGWAIAIAVVLIIVVLIVILIPKKKER